MKMNHASLVLVAGMAFGACGGSSSSGPLSTGLETSKTASSLSASEKSTLCKSANAYFTSLFSKGDMCKMFGLLGVSLGGGVSVAEAKSACNESYNFCMTMPEEKVDNSTTLSECTDGLSDCSATVGEIETCFNDSGTAMKAAMAAIPACSQITESTLTDTSTSTSTGETPDSCKTMEAKCPNLNSDQSSSSDF